MSIGEKVSGKQIVKAINEGRTLFRPCVKRSTHAAVRNRRLMNRNATTQKKLETRRMTKAITLMLRSRPNLAISLRTVSSQILAFSDILLPH